MDEWLGLMIYLAYGGFSILSIMYAFPVLLLLLFPHNETSRVDSIGADRSFEFKRTLE